MGTPHAHEPMPEREAERFRALYRAFQQALDPDDPWANAQLAAVVRAVDAAGWSRRTTGAALGVSRARLPKIAAHPPARRVAVPAFELGAAFPRSAVDAFRRAQDRIRDRRDRAERELAAAVVAAKEAGWSYPALASLAGCSDERLRQIATGAGPALDGVDAPAFTPFRSVPASAPKRAPRRALTADERERLAALAARARGATKFVGARLGAVPSREQVRALEESLANRAASEELSALLGSLKDDGVSWAELDEACGYRPGTSRQRALRHGHGHAPPSMRPYDPSRSEPARKLVSQLTEEPSV